MDGSEIKCPSCQKPAIAGAAFCAFCGEKLKATTPQFTKSRSIPLPDRRTLKGPCSVIYCGGNEIDIRRVGRLVAEAVKRPLPDVTRNLRNSKGFLAMGLDEQTAVSLAEKAERELNSRILVIPDEDRVPLPPVMRMRHAAVDAQGVRCEAYTWDQTEEVTASWNEVFLVSCGRLEVQHAVETLSESGAAIFPFRPVTTLTMQSKHEYLLDIVLFEPWRRLRLDQNTVAFSLTEMRQDSEHVLGALYRSAVNLERFGRAVPMNRGVSMLASGGSDAAWQSLTFLNKRDFDAYTYWLMQLVRYGLSIPE